MNTPTTAATVLRLKSNSRLYSVQLTALYVCQALLFVSLSGTFGYIYVQLQRLKRCQDEAMLQIDLLPELEDIRTDVSAEKMVLAQHRLVSTDERTESSQHRKRPDYLDHLRRYRMLERLRVAMAPGNLRHRIRHSKQRQADSRHSFGSDEFINKRRRVKKTERAALPIKHVGGINEDDAEDAQEWVWLTANSKIEKNILVEYCGAIHGQCAKRGRKLRGPRGSKGITGIKGPTGGTGLPGPRGPAGLMGPPGEAGVAGIDGRDGICRCQFPDILIKEVTVPYHYPPKVIIKPVYVPEGQTIPPDLDVFALLNATTTACPTMPPMPPTKPLVVKPEKPAVAGKPTVEPTRTDAPGSEVEDYPDDEYVFEWPPLLTEEVVTESPIIIQLLNATDDNETYVNMTTEYMSTTPGYTGPPTLGYNRRRCVLDVVGTPILHAESQFSSIGAWMIDTKPTDREMAAKRWVIDGYFTPVIYQYKNERDMMEKRQEIKYYIDFLSTGTGMAISNGSLYYHEHDSQFIVKYDLNTTKHIKQALPDLAFRDCKRKDEDTFKQCPRFKRQEYLYDQPHNFVDFAIDENGLWAVYHYENESYFVVTKLEFSDLYIVQTWNITMPPNVTSVANSFIMCGVFYVVLSGTDRETRINFAYDLFANREIRIDVLWSNPYRKMTMLDYNPGDRRIYFYDNGYMLSVPVRVKRFLSNIPPVPTAPANASSSTVAPGSDEDDDQDDEDGNGNFESTTTSSVPATVTVGLEDELNREL